MNVLNFIKKNGKEILLVFSGSLLPLLTLFISNHLEFGIKKYENHAVYTRLIFEQGLKPYRNKQIQYQHKNLELFDKMVEAIKYWHQ